jgi:hypothetical protein
LLRRCSGHDGRRCDALPRRVASRVPPAPRTSASCALPSYVGRADDKCGVARDPHRGALHRSVRRASQPVPTSGVSLYAMSSDGGNCPTPGTRTRRPPSPRQSTSSTLSEASGRPSRRTLPEYHLAALAERTAPLCVAIPRADTYGGFEGQLRHGQHQKRPARAGTESTAPSEIRADSGPGASWAPLYSRSRASLGSEVADVGTALGFRRSSSALVRAA